MINEFSPMTAAELMDRVVHVYKKSFGWQLAYAAIVAVIGIFAYFAFFVILIIGSMSWLAISFDSIDAYGDVGSVFGLFIGIAIIAIPAVFLYFSLSSAGHILLSRQAFFGHKISMPIRELPRVVGRIFCTILAQILAFVPFIAIAVLFALSFQYLFFIHNRLWILAIFGIIYTIGFALYANIFSLSIAVSAFERVTFVNALVRSWRLIRGEFWKVAGIRLLWWLVIMVIYSATYGILSLSGIGVVWLADFFDLGGVAVGVGVLVTLVTSLGSIVVTLAMTPLDGVFQATLYFNQRIKKEGLDIEIDLWRLQV